PVREHVRIPVTSNRLCRNVGHGLHARDRGAMVLLGTRPVAIASRCNPCRGSGGKPVIGTVPLGGDLLRLTSTTSGLLAAPTEAECFRLAENSVPRPRPPTGSRPRQESHRGSAGIRRALHLSRSRAQSQQSLRQTTEMGRIVGSCLGQQGERLL